MKHVKNRVFVHVIFIHILRTYARKFLFRAMSLVSVSFKMGRMLPVSRMNIVRDEHSQGCSECAVSSAFDMHHNSRTCVFIRSKKYPKYAIV
jgi:hypothetical protein